LLGEPRLLAAFRHWSEATLRRRRWVPKEVLRRYETEDGAELPAPRRRVSFKRPPDSKTDSKMPIERPPDGKTDSKMPIEQPTEKPIDKHGPKPTRDAERQETPKEARRQETPKHGNAQRGSDQPNPRGGKRARAEPMDPWEDRMRQIQDGVCESSDDDWDQEASFDWDDDFSADASSSLEKLQSEGSQAADLGEKQNQLKLQAGQEGDKAQGTVGKEKYDFGWDVERKNAWRRPKGNIHCAQEWASELKAPPGQRLKDWLSGCLRIRAARLPSRLNPHGASLSKGAVRSDSHGLPLAGSGPPFPLPHIGAWAFALGASFCADVI
jgi:hypothetical protein